MDDDMLNVIIDSLKNLSVSKIVCQKNRYWDPLDLDKLNKMQELFKIPTGVSDANISNSLRDLLLKFMIEFPSYYEKYFNVAQVPGKEMLLSKSILAEQWLKEKPLREVLNSEYYADQTSIELDETIGFLQSKISFGLPLLLKPLYDIKAPDVMFTRFIEIGAFKPLTRKLIELNIPRETAIYLTNNTDLSSSLEDGQLVNKIRKLVKGLPYWYQVQLEMI